MIYKGLMDSQEVENIFKRFDNIFLVFERSSSTYKLNTKEDLAAIDISAEVYNNIVDEMYGAGISGFTLKLISFGQGLMVTSYEISDEESSAVTALDIIKDYILELKSKYENIIILNKLGQSLDASNIEVEAENRRGGINTGYTGNPQAFQDFIYQKFSKDDSTGIGDFKRSVKLSDPQLRCDTLFISIIDYEYSTVGFRFKYDGANLINSTLAKLSNYQNFSIQRISKPNSIFADANNSNEVPADSDKIYTLIRGIDLKITPESLGEYIEDEAIPTFTSWVTKLVKRKVSKTIKTAPLGRYDSDFHFFSIDKTKIDKKLTTDFGLPIINKELFSSYELKTFDEWKKRKVAQPLQQEKVEEVIETSMKVFQETTEKYKPLSKNFFTDDRYRPGKELLANILTTRLGNSLGDRSPYTRRASRNPQLREGPSSLGDKRDVFKSVKGLGDNLEFLVRKCNQKGYSFLSPVEKSQLAKYYEKWIDTLSLDNVFVGETVNFFARSLDEMGIYPTRLNVEVDTIFGLRVPMFNQDVRRQGKGNHTFIFIINYKKQEITTSKYGGQDDARMFTKSFQDFDIRVDIINTVNRVLSEPKNFITNLPEEDVFYNTRGDTPFNQSKLSMTPESVATVFGSDTAKRMKDHPQTLYYEKPEEDTLTGRRKGFMVYREKRGGIGFFSFDPFYHDKDGHGYSSTDICMSPVTNPFRNIGTYDLEPHLKYHQSLRDTPRLNNTGQRDPQIWLDNFTEYILEKYLSDTKPTLKSSGSAICALVEKKPDGTGSGVVSPDMHIWLGNNVIEPGQLGFPFDAQALGRVPQLDAPKLSSSLKSCLENILRTIENYYRYEEEGSGYGNLTEVYEELQGLIRSNGVFARTWDKLTTKTLSQYLYKNPPNASDMASRRT